MLITSLADWGLPQAVVDAYSGLGLQNLYPWQAAALESGADGSNLVYCAPTSGGKSVVADVLMLRRLHQRHTRGPRRPRWQQGAGSGRALVILPYISVVAEKAAHLTGLVRGLRWVVRGYMGASQGTPLSKRDEVIAVCTPEKANMALHLLLAEQRLHELAAVVVDEAHMVADPQRGALLEVLLTKLRAAARPGAVQVVAMSATMGGLDSLSAWLDARLFMTNFRPVPLTEHVVMGGRVYRKTAPLVPGGEVEGVLEEDYVLPPPLGRDKDQLVHLVSHVVGAGHSVLVFCSSRAAAEAAAGLIAEMLPAVLPLRVVSPEVEAGRRSLVEGLREELGGGLSPKLEKLLLAGVAYHHAGLTAQERGAVEAGYRGGAISVLTATSTLAAGVNLPARRVILRTIHQGAGPVSRAQYLQMIGRAGRAGQCSFGESYLMCNADPTPTLAAELGRLLVDRLPPLTSQLVGEGGVPSEELLAAASGGALGAGGVGLEGLEGVAPGMQRLLLEGVAVGIAQDGPAIEALLGGTLLAQQVEWPWLSQVGRLALAALRQRRLISLPPPAVPGQVVAWRPSPLGAAVTCAGLPPDSGLALHGRLDELRSHVVLGTVSHLLYGLLGEPLFEVFDWRIWQRLLGRLSPAQQRVADVVGVDEDYVMRCLRGGRADPALSSKHGRLAAALLLDALAEGASPAALEEAWGAPMGLSKAGFTRGQLQHWQQDVAKWAGMAAVLADKAGYWQLEVALAHVAAQLSAGVRPELLPLMQVTGMRGEQARRLYAAGLTRPDLVAAAPAQEVVAALAAGGKRPVATGAARGLITNTTPIGTKSAAERLLAACRQHIVAEALAKHAEGGGEGAARAAAVTELLEEEGEPGRPDLDPQLGLLAQLGPGGSVRLSGQLVARRVTLRQPEQVRQVLAAWRLQPAFAWALVLPPGSPGASGGSSDGGLPPAPAPAPSTIAAAGGAAPEGEDTLSSSITGLVAGPPQPLALALCWSERDVVLLQLPPTPPHQGGQGMQLVVPPLVQPHQQQQPVPESIEEQVYSCVQSVFGDPHRVALCWDAPSSVPALCGALGVGALAARVDDPLAAFCCWAPDAIARAGDPPPVGSALLKLVCSRVTPEYAMKVPLISEGETWAARQATFAWVAMPVVWRLLAAGHCSTVYRPLLASTQDAVAGAGRSGVRLLRPQAVAAVAEVGWALQHLAQVLSQQLQGAVASPQALVVLLEAVGAPGMGGGPGGRRKAAPNTPETADAAVVASIRAACKGGQQAWLQLLQAALTYCRLAGIHTAGTALLVATGHNPHPLLRLGSAYSSLPGGLSLSCSPLLQAMLVTGVGLPWCPVAVAGPLLRHAPEPLPGVVRMLCRSGAGAADPLVAGYCGQVVWPHTSDLPQPGWPGEGRPAGSGSVAYLEPGSRAMRRGWVGAGHIQEVAASSSGPGQLPPVAGAASEVCHGNQQQQQQTLNGYHHHQYDHQQQQQQQHIGHHQEQQQPFGHHQQQQWQQHPQQQQQQHPQQQHQWQQQQQQQQQWQGAGRLPEPVQVSYATWCWQLRPALAPAAPDQVFLGCDLAHLDLLGLAGLGQDPALLAATAAPDPPAAAAAAWQPHWPPCASRALAAVAAGCVEGVPVPAAAAPAVLWQLVVGHLASGGSPGQLGKVVGLEAGAAGALLDSLAVAFPGLGAALERVVAASAKTGYVVSPCGRRLLCAQPPPSTSFSTREARLRHEARRLATSLALTAARGDLLLALVAGLSGAWGLGHGGARRPCAAGGGAVAAAEGGVGQAAWALVSEAALVIQVEGAAMMGAWGVGRHAVGAALAQVWPDACREGAGGMVPPFTWWWGATLDPVAGNLLLPRSSHAG